MSASSTQFTRFFYPKRINFLVRAEQPQGLLRPVRAELLAHDPTAAVEVRLLRESRAFALLPSQVGGILLGSLGGLGLFLAAAGLNGVLAYFVRQRIPEIGLRLAVGATGRQIVRIVLWQNARLLITGIAVGLLCALLSAKPLALFLVPGIIPGDPENLALVLAFLLAAGLLSVISPVSRAIRIDPVRALRYE